MSIVLNTSRESRHPEKHPVRFLQALPDDLRFFWIERRMDVKEVAMKRVVTKLALLFVSMSALATPALAIGTWPTPELPAYHLHLLLPFLLW
jgi:hypothetical protein